MAIDKKSQQIIEEYLRNDTDLDGAEISKFSRIMREKSVFKYR